QGFRSIDEPGAPSWFELHTRDYSRAVDFYRQVFRWDIDVFSDSDEMRYTVLKIGEDQLAGIMDVTGSLSEGTPGYWQVYFRTKDTDAAIATVAKLGGQVIRPGEDTPYGRLAASADPMGARFALLGPRAMPAQDA
ncbi:MAG TPA: VOC family protein, partial [Acidimicrobiales bacterium]|nr:VOC family protein [Acidimicrobiales bacterium]